MIFWTGVAEAGGFFYPDSGIVAGGRGCAWVVGAEGQFAQYYNPAGLVNTKQPEINIGLSGIKQDVTFTRLKDDGTSYDPIRNEGKLFLIPEIGFAGSYKDKFGYAFGFTSGFAADYVYPSDGPQRYTIIDNVVQNFQIGPSFAYRPKKQITFGIGLQWQVLRVDEYLVVTTSGEDDPRGDVAVGAFVWDKFQPGLNVGILVDPAPWISFGASAQPKLHFTGKGHGYLDFTGHGTESVLDQTVWTDDDITLEIELPWFVRAGVLVRPDPKLEIEADFVWEGWKALEAIKVSDIDVRVTGANGFIDEQVAPNLDLPAGFNNSWSVRLGGEYDATDRLAVRAGGFYESSSLSLQEVSVSLVDGPKAQISAGATVRFPKQHLAFDVHASRVFYADLDPRDSHVTQVNVYDPGNEAVVGNGHIDSSGYAFGGAVRVLFGKAVSRQPSAVSR